MVFLFYDFFSALPGRQIRHSPNTPEANHTIKREATDWNEIDRYAAGLDKSRAWCGARAGIAEKNLDVKPKA